MKQETKVREIPGTYKILDGLLSEKYQNYIESHLKDTDTWRYRESLVDKKGPWAHLSGFSNVFLNEDGIRNNDIFNIVAPITKIACDHVGYNITSICYARSFLTLPIPGAKGISSPHVDIDDEDHLVCLYYVNDADGDTILFDKMDMGEEFDESQELNILARITPKKGRILLFCGRQYHAASLPEKGARIIVNFDILGAYRGKSST